MSPPKMVYIGPNDYKVKVRTHMDSPELLGETKIGLSELHLHRKQPPSVMRGTLIHELIHAIIFEGGIRKAAELDHESEERLVGLIAPWILALLRDNPELVEYLMENREREY